MQPPHRGRKWLRWALGFALVAVIVAMAGVVWKTTVDTSSAETKPKPADTARAYAEAWRDGNYTRMYQLLSPHSHRVITFAAFKQAFQQAAETTTLKRISLVGATRVRRGIATTPVVANTREFAHVHQNLSLRLVPVPAGFRVALGTAAGVPRPECRASSCGCIPTRRLREARSGPATARCWPRGPRATACIPRARRSRVTGYVKTPDPDGDRGPGAKGWPAHRPYGQAGLEQSLDPSPRRPAGDRFAGGVRQRRRPRMIASRAGRKPQNVVTTLDPTPSTSADALGWRSRAAAVVLDPSSRELWRRSVGLGMDTLQPPGIVVQDDHRLRRR